MKTNFVLENFDEYLSGVYSRVNEAKAEPLTKNEARDIIDSLLKLQKRSSMSSTKVKALVTSVFGKEISQRISKSDGYWADEREGIANNPQEEEDKKKAEFFEKIKEFDQK